MANTYIKKHTNFEILRRMNQKINRYPHWFVSFGILAVHVQPQIADKQISFEPNLPTNRTFFEFCQQTTLTSTIDFRQMYRLAKY